MKEDFYSARDDFSEAKNIRAIQRCPIFFYYYTTLRDSQFIRCRIYRNDKQRFPNLQNKMLATIDRTPGLNESIIARISQVMRERAQPALPNRKRT